MHGDPLEGLLLNCQVSCADRVGNRRERHFLDLVQNSENSSIHDASNVLLLKFLKCLKKFSRTNLDIQFKTTSTRSAVAASAPDAPVVSIALPSDLSSLSLLYGVDNCDMYLSHSEIFIQSF